MCMIRVSIGARLVRMLLLQHICLVNVSSVSPTPWMAGVHQKCEAADMSFLFAQTSSCHLQNKMWCLFRAGKFGPSPIERVKSQGSSKWVVVFSWYGCEMCMSIRITRNPIQCWAYIHMFYPPAGLHHNHDPVIGYAHYLETSSNNHVTTYIHMGLYIGCTYVTHQMVWVNQD